MQRWTTTTALLSVTLLMAAVGCEDKSVKESRGIAYREWAKNRANMFFEMAEKNFATGQLDEAERRCQEAIQLDGDNPDYRLLLGKIYIETGKYKPAEKQLGIVRDQMPDLAAPYYLLGVVTERQNRHAEALNYYNLAFSKNQASFAPIAAAAEVLVHQGEYQRAYQMLHDHIKLADQDAVAYELAGRVALMARQYEQARAFLNRAATLNPEKNEYQELIARADFCDGQFRQALETIQILEQLPAYKEAGWLYLMKADCQMALGQKHDARVALDKAESFQPESVEVWVARGKLALLDEDPSQAIRATNQARQLQSDNLEAALVMGCALLQQKRPRTALEVLHNVQNAHPKDVTLYCLLGRAYQAMGEMNKARQCYDYAEWLNPEQRKTISMLEK